MNHRTSLLAAGIVGATGVLLGAFGAHLLRDLLLERGMKDTWETAVIYQLMHTVALLGAAAYLKHASGAAMRRVGWAASSWTVGTVLFSGSLYGVALGGPHFLVFVTPFGGIALVTGWLLVIAAARAKED